jgi:hypothetical protein
LAWEGKVWRRGIGRRVEKKDNRAIGLLAHEIDVLDFWIQGKDVVQLVFEAAVYGGVEIFGRGAQVVETLEGEGRCQALDFPQQIAAEGMVGIPSMPSRKERCAKHKAPNPRPQGAVLLHDVSLRLWPV